MPSKRSKSSSEARFASAARFQVDWGGPAGSEGFLRVEFGPVAAAGGSATLTRAFRGDKALLAWATADPRRKAGALRTVTIQLMDATGTPVGRLALSNARPDSYTLSPLDALAGGIVTESLGLSFASLAILD